MGGAATDMTKHLVQQVARQPRLVVGQQVEYYKVLLNNVVHEHEYIMLKPGDYMYGTVEVYDILLGSTARIHIFQF